MLTIQKLIGLSLAALLSASAYADDNQGFYGAFNIGSSWSSASSQPYASSTPTMFGALTTYGNSSLVDASNIAVMLNGGYQFKYLALEAAYTHPANFTENDTGLITLAGFPLAEVNSNDTSSLNYLSFLGKFTYPMHKISIFAGPGLAIVFKDAQQRSTSVSEDGVTVVNTTEPGVNSTFYRPEIAVGASVNLCKKWLARVEYDRVFGESNIGVANAEKNFLPNINTMTVGLVHTFS